MSKTLDFSRYAKRIRIARGFRQKKARLESGSGGQGMLFSDVPVDVLKRTEEFLFSNPLNRMEGFGVLLPILRGWASYETNLKTGVNILRGRDSVIDNNVLAEEDCIRQVLGNIPQNAILPLFHGIGLARTDRGILNAFRSSLAEGVYLCNEIGKKFNFPYFGENAFPFFEGIKVLRGFPSYVGDEICERIIREKSEKIIAGLEKRAMTTRHFSFKNNLVSFEREHAGVSYMESFFRYLKAREFYLV